MTESGSSPGYRKDPRAVIAASRAYLDDIRAGHVSFSDEGAPFLVMSSHLQELLDLLDDMYIPDAEPSDEQYRLRAQLRQALPARYRDSEIAAAMTEVLAAIPGDVAANVTRWLRAAQAEIPPGSELTTAQAFADAIRYRQAQAASGPERSRATHRGQVGMYEMTAGGLGLTGQLGGIIDLAGIRREMGMDAGEDGGR